MSPRGLPSQSRNTTAPNCKIPVECGSHSRLRTVHGDRICGPWAVPSTGRRHWVDEALGTVHSPSVGGTSSKEGRATRIRHD
jgi:hypothetical protein